MKSIRVLVCGSREWKNYKSIIAELRRIQDKANISVLIEGESRGADKLAGVAASELGIKVLPFPANWKKYGLAAGPIRNRQMLEEGKPDLVIAFHRDFETSKGTKNMVIQAKRKKIKVIIKSR